jgi:hypothetical protein
MLHPHLRNSTHVVALQSLCQGTPYPGRSSRDFDSDDWGRFLRPRHAENSLVRRDGEMPEKLIWTVRSSCVSRACRPFTAGIVSWRLHEGCKRGSGEADARVSLVPGRYRDCPRSYDGSYHGQLPHFKAHSGARRQVNFLVSFRVATLLFPTFPEGLICRSTMRNTDLCQSPSTILIMLIDQG